MQPKKFKRPPPKDAVGKLVRAKDKRGWIVTLPDGKPFKPINKMDRYSGNIPNWKTRGLAIHAIEAFVLNDHGMRPAWASLSNDYVPSYSPYVSQRRDSGDLQFIYEHFSIPGTIDIRAGRGGFIAAYAVTSNYRWYLGVDSTGRLSWDREHYYWDINDLIRAIELLFVKYWSLDDEPMWYDVYDTGIPHDVRFRYWAHKRPARMPKFGQPPPSNKPMDSPAAEAALAAVRRET